MQLLVSVSSAIEAAAALAGDADVIDAKDPAAGPLGPVALPVFREIRGTVGEARTVSAALGDASDASALEQLAWTFAEAGASFLKVGFAGIDRPACVTDLLRAATRGAGVQPRIVAVAYADADRAASLTPDAILDAALRAGAHGVLLDTFDKSGPGLRSLVTTADLRGWIEAGRLGGLLVAIAGQLTVADIPFVGELGPDIVGVRGAACEGGRAGRVSAARVRQLHDCCVTDAGRARRQAHVAY